MATLDGKDAFTDWVTVLTTLPTLPLPPNSERAAFETERLIIRPVTEDDLDALHELRTQPEVMRNTRRGLIDDDLAMTRERLASSLTPNDARTFTEAVCLRAAGDNKLIGIGGVHNFHSVLGWPEVGYMFHSAHWGKGYATEFVRGLLQLYSALPRPAAPVPLRVTRSSLPPDLAAIAGPGTAKKGGDDDGGDGDAEVDPTLLTVTAETVVVEEKVTALVADNNAESQRVVDKAGFKRFLSFVEEDNRNPGTDFLVHVLQYLPNRKPLAA